MEPGRRARLRLRQDHVVARGAAAQMDQTAVGGLVHRLEAAGPLVEAAQGGEIVGDHAAMRDLDRMQRRLLDPANLGIADVARLAGGLALARSPRGIGVQLGVAAGEHRAPVLHLVGVELVQRQIHVEHVVAAAGALVGDARLDAGLEGAEVRLHEVLLVLHLPPEMVEAGPVAPRRGLAMARFGELLVVLDLDHADVVVGVAIGEETGADVPLQRRDLEAAHAGVERDRAVEIGDEEVDVPETPRAVAHRGSLRELRDRCLHPLLPPAPPRPVRGVASPAPTRLC